MLLARSVSGKDMKHRRAGRKRIPFSDVPGFMGWIDCRKNYCCALIECVIASVV